MEMRDEKNKLGYDIDHVVSFYPILYNKGKKMQINRKHILLKESLNKGKFKFMFYFKFDLRLSSIRSAHTKLFLP